MKRLITTSSSCLALLLWLYPSYSLALEEVSQPDVFTPTAWAEPLVDATYLGDLTGWPHTFSFTVATTSVVSYEVATVPNEPPVSLLLVREETRGVSEVARLTGTAATWDVHRANRYGVRVAQSETVSATLAPGSYKLEVSSPNNHGRYVLQVGEGDQSGFLATLIDTFRVHAFMGTWLSALLTWRVVLVFAIVLSAVWWWQRRRTS